VRPAGLMERSKKHGIEHSQCGNELVKLRADRHLLLYRPLLITQRELERFSSSLSTAVGCWTAGAGGGGRTSNDKPFSSMTVDSVTGRRNIVRRVDRCQYSNRVVLLCGTSMISCMVKSLHEGHEAMHHVRLSRAFHTSRTT